MCDPVSMTVGGLAGAQGILGVYQQGQAMEAQAESEAMRHKMEVERAQRDAEMKQTMLNQQALEDSQELQLDRERLALEAMRERGAIKASGAEAGLGGVSQIRSFLASNIAEDNAQAVQNLNEQNAERLNINL